MKIYKGYFIAAFVLLLVEIFIALYMHDKFVRPYFGDFLVVIFLYCLLKSFWNLPVLYAALHIFIFACLVEFSQYFHLVKILGWQNIKAAKIILGDSFSWSDILNYLGGIVTVIIIERLGKKSQTKTV